MDPTASRHRRSSSSSDRLLGLFTFSPPSVVSAGDELNEAELFWSGDAPETENQRFHQPLPPSKANQPSISCPQNSGILAVLSEPAFRSGDQPILCRKPTITSTSSRMVPSIPRPPGQGPQDTEYFSQSLPSRKFQQSAPMKVPILSSKTTPRRKNDELALVDDDIEDDDEMLPPHEIVARGSGVSPKTTSSVLEGIGRTLKGRDLRQRKFNFDRFTKDGGLSEYVLPP
ncbi:protein S40-7-like [Prosopis cineraria]|uniref:protein S40-7-like n=1 Tax=Prosopis cineraria TaxID=364024 RepID=UPI0024104D4A|nr:protein S40-7-like [Prosopis cineraria]